MASPRRWSGRSSARPSRSTWARSASNATPRTHFRWSASAPSAGPGSSPGEQSASRTGGRVGVLRGARSHVLQDADGQVLDTRSNSAGRDYPGVGPQLSFLKDTKRASFVAVSDGQALEGFHALAMYEGILPALEPAHAVFLAMRRAREMKRHEVIVITISGRGDKDMATEADAI